MWYEFDNESQIMSDNVGYWGKRCSARRSLSQFQSFLLVLLQLGWRWACGEMSFHLFCLVVLLILSVYPNDQRKSMYRPSRLKCRLNSLSVYQSFLSIMKMMFQSWYITSKKSSRCWNACRASDRCHHLISSSRIRYPKKTQKKNVRSPFHDERPPNDQ